MKKNLYNIDIIKMLDIDKNLTELNRFLIKNRTDIYIDTDKKNKLLDFSLLSRNFISTMYEKFKTVSNLDMFSFIQTFGHEEIPDILFWKYLNIDYYIIRDIFPNQYSVINSLPEYRSRILYNLHEILDKDLTKILNVTQFQKTVVRDLCSRSYNNFSDMWLTGDLLINLTDFYSMTTSFNISKLYNFSYPEQTLLSTIFSYYFLTKCIRDKDEKIKFMNNLSFLGNKVTIVSVVNIIQDIIEENGYIDIETQEQLLKVVHEISPKQIKSLDLKVFNTLYRNFGSDQIVSLISVDYPGYWLYNLLAAISGDKTNLYFILKKINKFKDVIVFSDNLLKSPMFFRSLIRDIK